MKKYVTPSLLPLFLLFLLQPFQTTAKQSSGVATLTGAATEHTLVKFALSPHAMGQIRATLTTDEMYINEQNLAIHMYTDAEWPAVKKEPLCTEKIKLAKATSKIYFGGRKTNVDKFGDPLPKHQQKKGLGEQFYRAEVVNLVDNSRATRPTYWYFTIDDCSLEMYGHDDEIPKIHYTIRVMDDTSESGKPKDESTKELFGRGKRQKGFTHLPADEKGMVVLHWMNILFSVVLGLLLGKKMIDSVQSRGDVHAAILIVLVSCGLNALSSLSEIIHLTLYANNGVGSYALDACSAHFEAMCDALVAIVLLSVGCGWTLPSDVLTGNASAKVFAGFSNPVGSLNHMFTCGNFVKNEPAGFMALTVLILHSALAQWGRMYDDDFDSYHTLEHPPGRALMMFRALLGLLFAGGVASVRGGGRCPPPLMKFLTKFALVGIAWFVSLPFVSTFVASTLPFYARHQAMSVASTVLQNCSLASLAWLFTADSSASAYHRFSKVKEGGGLSDMSSLGGGSGGGDGDSSGKVRPAKEWTVFGKTKVRLD